MAEYHQVLERIAAALERQADAAEAMAKVSTLAVETQADVFAEMAAARAEDRAPQTCRSIHPTRSLGCSEQEGHEPPHRCQVFGSEPVTWTDEAYFPVEG